MNAKAWVRSPGTAWSAAARWYDRGATRRAIGGARVTDRTSTRWEGNSVRSPRLDSPRVLWFSGLVQKSYDTMQPVGLTTRVI